MKIKKIQHNFSICKIPDITQVNLTDEFCFLGKTDEEISLVCISENSPLNTTHRDDGWKAFRIEGVLDFSLIGILSKISTLLADNGIGIFAISTYNTDYILTKSENYDMSIKLLQQSGYHVS